MSRSAHLLVELAQRRQTAWSRPSAFVSILEFGPLKEMNQRTNPDLEQEPPATMRMLDGSRLSQASWMRAVDSSCFAVDSTNQQDAGSVMRV
jgi:hypothetical protein